MKTVRLALFVSLVLVLLHPGLQAQPPRPIAFQGILTDTLGKPKPDGPYELRFSLYGAPSGGPALWTELRTLPVLHGLFTVMLGELTPLYGLDFSSPCWLGIQVGGALELVPRLQLSAGGFSYQARNAWRADQADSLTGGRIAPGSLVRSVNTLTDNVKLVAGSNVSIGQSHDTLRISAGGGGGGFTLPYTDSISSTGSVLKVSNTGTGIGVWGVAKDATGVLGNSTDGNGITGFSSTKNGVYGHTSSDQGFGVSGRNESTSAWGFFGAEVNFGGLLYPGVGAYGYGQFGVIGNGHDLGLNHAGTLGTTCGVFGSVDKGSGVLGVADQGTGVYGIGPTGVGCSGDFFQSDGKFSANPTSTQWTTNKPATVKTRTGEKIKLFTEEAAELFFNDYGDGRLNRGSIHIELDPLYLETVTVDESHPLKVFVQLEDDCKGVYVTRKTATGFDVMELQGGTSDARFTYRVMCKRKYYEDERLATEEQDIQFNTRVLQTVWPEVQAKREEMKAMLGAIRTSSGQGAKKE
jgi:hypothetical protein